MPEDDSLPASTDSIAWYELHAGEAASRYESLAPDQINDWLRAFLPGQPGFILDVGAGSGRDAAWLASDGHEVIAVEPSEQMRTHGQELHAGTAKITWINDRLPGLEKVHRLGVLFDFILLNAVWMHVPAASRQRAFRKLITLLKPGGRLAISFRQPDPYRGQSMFPCHMDEFERLARDYGSIIEKWDTTKDGEVLPDIEWTRLIIRLPDDGTGALPVIRHIILRDSKSSTYKLALLRVLARIAEGSLGLLRLQFRSVGRKTAAKAIKILRSESLERKERK